MNLDIEWVEYQAGAEYAAKTKEVFEPGLVDAIKGFTGLEEETQNRPDGRDSIELWRRSCIYEIFRYSGNPPFYFARS